MSQIRSSNREAVVTFAILAMLVAFVDESQAVTMAWSPVGNPGNAADPLTHAGAVSYSYSIGTYDVTNRIHQSVPLPVKHFIVCPLDNYPQQ